MSRSLPRHLSVRQIQAVLSAQDDRLPVESWLITETNLDGDLKGLAKKLGVKHKVISLTVRMIWGSCTTKLQTARFLLFPPSKGIKGVDKVRRGA